MPPLSASEAPSLTLRSPDGATARIYLDGAHVASWVPAGGEEQLFVSSRAHYGPGYAIRGGIPICWPQFGKTGPLRQHGFARLERWALVEPRSSELPARAVLRLTDSAATRAEWPHGFVAELIVQVGGDALDVTLAVRNSGTDPFNFTAALHPYFRVREAFATEVHGLGGRRYRDALEGGAEFIEHGDALTISGAIDRVYLDAPDTLQLREPHRTLQLTKSGFSDAVVWNPGADGTRSRDDFASGDEQHMVCVEAAAVALPITLAPGERWAGTQTMRAT